MQDFNKTAYSSLHVAWQHEHTWPAYIVACDQPSVRARVLQGSMYRNKAQCHMIDVTWTVNIVAWRVYNPTEAVRSPYIEVIFQEV